MDVYQAFQEIQAGTIRPIYFLYGDERYFMDRWIRAVAEKVVAPETRDFNYDLFYAEETEAERVVQVASSFPLMADRRMVVVRSIQKWPASDKNRLRAYVQSPLGSTCLVLTAEEVDLRQTVYKELIQMTTAIECKSLYENQAVEWVIQQGRTKGVRISKQAAERLVTQTGCSLWALFNEMEKLLTFASGRKELDVADIDAIAGFSRKYNLWEFVDAVASKNLSKALQILHFLLVEKQSGVLLITELTRRMFLLLRLRAELEKKKSPDVLAKQFMLRPYFIRLYVSQANRFSTEELKEALAVLLLADRALKTGTLDTRSILTLAVYDIVKGPSASRFFRN